ncbi:MAG: sugar ABC transporter permease [Chloroflexi bacterium]|nr:sugar ABC transporter permease [Chloroflexota bacterium]MBI5080990.1 sugar ABC transporter permease [Chloroflexota bacterium]MBI5348247.1 sugar ABC transporter permease [Chloroflexota bacterium]
MATLESQRSVRSGSQFITRQQMRALNNFFSAMLFLLPSLIIFVFFVFIPLLKTLNLSLYLTDAIGRPAAFNGIENYQRIFEEKDLYNSLKVSLAFTLYVVPTTMIVALFLAVLSNVETKGISVFRVIFASTIAVSGATASLIFLFLFHPAIGIFNYILDLARLPRVQWLLTEATALISVSMVTVWLTLGFNTVIFLASLQGIPEELYESAKIDGAGFWSSFRHITIPMISPTIFFLIVVSTLGALQAFTQISVMTHGGPVESTNVIVYLIYRAFYFNGQYGIAAALSIILFLIMFVLTLIQFGVIERRVHYN